MQTNPPSTGTNAFTRDLIDKLRRHPKRIVFTEGEDLRVLRVAERLVRAEAAVPILLGSRERIQAMAVEHGVKLRFVNVLDPEKSSDFPLFCQRYEKIARYRGQELVHAADFVAKPHYFGALMTQYGQADALVGGNKVWGATVFRALLNTVKPLPEVPKVFGVQVLIGDHLRNLGGDGMLFLADCGLVPHPDVPQLAAMALETGKLARHFLGRTPRVALLSHSTRGSSATEDARRMAAAAALAKDKARQDYLDIEIDGELQADVALDPEAAAGKLPHAGQHKSADVLIFPNLDAAHISLKLLKHVASAQDYGQMVLGLARPAAQVSQLASEETIFGTAAAVGVEAIKYHQIFPDGEV